MAWHASRLLPVAVFAFAACGSRPPSASSAGPGAITAGAGGRAGAAFAAGTAGPPPRAGASAAAGGSATPPLDGGAPPRDAAPPDAAAPVVTAPDGPDGQAFDPVRGQLNVDYRTYLAKHDVVFNRPNTDPIRGLTVGNGRTGAIAWSANGLTLQVSGVDLSQQTAFSAGLATLRTTPALDAGGPRFEQRLALYDGTLTTRYGEERTITVMGSPKSEVMGIHVEDGRADVTAVAFELSLWDVSALGNAGAVRDLESWKRVATYAEAESAGFSRGQSDPDGFGYTFAATVEGASFSTEVVGDRRIRITITPSASYTIWFAAASRVHAEGGDSVASAKALLARVKRAGYAATLAAYQQFWHDFWSRSFVQYGNGEGDADYLENVYYLATYMIAAGGYGKYPFHFINGVFRATGDDTKWSNAYWYWNQRDIYNSFFASNHAELVARWNALYSDNAAALEAFTMSHHGIEGLWVPETMGWNGNADGTIHSDFTKLIYSTGVEAAVNMYRQYLYTGDADYLRVTAYPFMREVAKFYRAKLSREGSGPYYMALSNAHETYWSVKNAITDLAAVRQLFPIAIEVGQSFGLDAELRAGFQDVLDHLVPHPQNATDYLPHDPPESPSRNGENVACELIWPYDQTGIGAPDYDRALSTFRHRPHPYDNVWANDAVQAARLGLGDDAMAGMRTMLDKYQAYPNGMTDNTNGVFEYLGVHLAALNESLLQSHDDVIRVLPALPSDDGFVARFTLAAQRGFLVSAEREAGEVKYVGLKSERGGPVVVINPWHEEPAQVRVLADDAIALRSDAAELSFRTEPGAVYVIERVAKPLGDYEYAHIEGVRNDGVKTLAGTRRSLGLEAMP